MEVVTPQQLKPLEDAIRLLTQQVQWLLADRDEWVPFEKAIQLTGRSRSWFNSHRTAGTLPIKLRPRTAGSRRVMFSRADCEAYGRDNDILPPLPTYSLSLAQ